MKRRNADIGKLRRPMKRTKVTEGLYGNSMLYVKFVMLWSSVALLDFMLEFRFEFLWPLWLLLKAIYNSYHYKGLTFAVLFTLLAVTSDMVCYYFVPMQVLTYAAGVYVWMHSIWNTLENKSVGMGMVALCGCVVYLEAWRSGLVGAALGWAGAGAGTAPPAARDLWDAALAAHALGFPALSLGACAKEMLEEVVRIRTRMRVREQNEFYFKLMRDAVGIETPSTYSASLTGSPEWAEAEAETEVEAEAEVKQNGTVKRRQKPALTANGHCTRDIEHSQLHAKLEQLEQHLEKKNRARDSSTQSQRSNQSQTSVTVPNSVHSNVPNGVHHSVHNSTQPSPHAPHTNGHAKGPGFEDNPSHCKSQKSTKYDAKCDKKEVISFKEDRKKKKRELDKEIDSHKSTEHSKEQIVKDVESTKECVKIKECNNIHKEKEEERKREREEERRKEKERERELKEKEREREREKERERELLSARECAEELARLRAALAASQQKEAETARLLAAADKQRRANADLKQQQMSVWRCGERAALERRLGDERRARLAAEQQLKARRTPHGECESGWCRRWRGAMEAESAALRHETQRARDALAHANQQVASLEAEKRASPALGASGAVLKAEAETARLNNILSAETRLKLELLSALGDANRKMHIQDSIIRQQEKQLEELKAQMLAVMPAPPGGARGVGGAGGAAGSPLDPNATVYTPKQLCSDA